MADTNYDGIEYLLNHLKSVQADAEENGYGDTGQTAEDAADKASAAAESEAAAKTSAENATEYESAAKTSAANAETSSETATNEENGASEAEAQMEAALESLAAVDELLDGKAIIFYDPDDLGVYAYAPD